MRSKGLERIHSIVVVRLNCLSFGFTVLLEIGGIAGTGHCGDDGRLELPLE